VGVKIGCPVPVQDRLVTLRATIASIQDQKDVEVVPLVITDNQKVLDWCEKSAVKYLVHENILADKWNAGFKFFKDSVDFVLFSGSDDLYYQGYCREMVSYMLKNSIEAAGIEQYYFLDIGDDGYKRMAFWSGYKNERRGETVGAGRMLSYKALDAISWAPFNTGSMRYMDSQMTSSLATAGINIVSSGLSLPAMGVTCPAWKSKRKFENIVKECPLIPWYRIDRVLSDYFPEVFLLDIEGHIKENDRTSHGK